MAEEKHAGGRPRKGTLEFRGKSWHARLTVTVDGEAIRKWFDLGTDSKAVARRKLAKLLVEQSAGTLPAPEAAKAPETVDSFAGPWLAARELRGLPSAGNERRYYEHVWKKAVGKLPLGAVRAGHIQGVINEAVEGKLRGIRDGRYSRESIKHLRATILRMLEGAWREEIVSENVAKRTEVPELDEDKRPRAVLTDAEIWELVRHEHVDPELKLLVLMSRTIGGMRTGDLNTLTWGAFSPDFATCTFVRRKTRRKRPMPQTLAVPEVVRPFIKVWWELHDSPTTGPVFPVRKGERAGELKKATKQSYAVALRRNLRIAFGLDAWNVKEWRFCPVEGRSPTPREIELLVGTVTVQPVDFHSTRRAYATALARVGVNEQTAMVLTGHADGKTHKRYVEAASIRALPAAAAVPILNAGAAPLVANQFRLKDETKLRAEKKKPAGLSSQPADFLSNPGAGEEIRTLDVHLGKVALYR